MLSIVSEQKSNFSFNDYLKYKIEIVRYFILAIKSL